MTTARDKWLPVSLLVAQEDGYLYGNREVSADTFVRDVFAAVRADPPSLLEEGGENACAFLSVVDSLGACASDAAALVCDLLREGVLCSGGSARATPPADSLPEFLAAFVSIASAHTLDADLALRLLQGMHGHTQGVFEQDIVAGLARAALVHACRGGARAQDRQTRQRGAALLDALVRGFRENDSLFCIVAAEAASVLTVALPADRGGAPGGAGGPSPSRFLYAVDALTALPADDFHQVLREFVALVAGRPADFADAALPDLLRALARADGSYYGDATCTLLAQLTTHESPRVRAAALAGLFFRPAVLFDAACERCYDGAAAVRSAACEALVDSLTRLRSPAQTAEGAQLLAERLLDAKSGVRRAACRALVGLVRANPWSSDLQAAHLRSLAAILDAAGGGGDENENAPAGAGADAGTAGPAGTQERSVIATTKTVLGHALAFAETLRGALASAARLLLSPLPTDFDVLRLLEICLEFRVDGARAVYMDVILLMNNRNLDERIERRCAESVASVLFFNSVEPARDRALGGGPPGGGGGAGDGAEGGDGDGDGDSAAILVVSTTRYLSALVNRVLFFYASCRPAPGAAAAAAAGPASSAKGSLERELLLYDAVDTALGKAVAHVLREDRSAAPLLADADGPAGASAAEYVAECRAILQGAFSPRQARRRIQGALLTKLVAGLSCPDICTRFYAARVLLVFATVSDQLCTVLGEPLLQKFLDLLVDSLAAVREVLSAGAAPLSEDVCIAFLSIACLSRLASHTLASVYGCSMTDPLPALLGQANSTVLAGAYLRFLAEYERFLAAPPPGVCCYVHLAVLPATALYCLAGAPYVSKLLALLAGNVGQYGGTLAPTALYLAAASAVSAALFDTLAHFKLQQDGAGGGDGGSGSGSGTLDDQAATSAVRLSKQTESLYNRSGAGFEDESASYMDEYAPVFAAADYSLAVVQGAFAALGRDPAAGAGEDGSGPPGASGAPGALAEGLLRSAELTSITVSFATFAATVPVHYRTRLPQYGRDKYLIEPMLLELISLMRIRPDALGDVSVQHLAHAGVVSCASANPTIFTTFYAKRQLFYPLTLLPAAGAAAGAGAGGAGDAGDAAPSTEAFVVSALTGLIRLIQGDLIKPSRHLLPALVLLASRSGRVQTVCRYLFRILLDKRPCPLRTHVVELLAGLVTAVDTVPLDAFEQVARVLVHHVVDAAICPGVVDGLAAALLAGGRPPRELGPSVARRLSRVLALAFARVVRGEALVDVGGDAPPAEAGAPGAPGEPDDAGAAGPASAAGAVGAGSSAPACRQQRTEDLREALRRSILPLVDGLDGESQGILEASGLLEFAAQEADPGEPAVETARSMRRSVRRSTARALVSQSGVFNLGDE